MVRAVTADYVLFDESIEEFRPTKPNVTPDAITGVKGSFSYILTPFPIYEEWRLPNCTINPSIILDLSAGRSAFISTIENPPHCNHHNSHLFGIAIATIASVITGTPCKSTKSDLLGSNGKPSNHELSQLALIYPISTAGPGHEKRYFSKSKNAKHIEDMRSLIESLHRLPYDKYVICMQALRLIHLSHLNLRDDFGLAYLLAVSAIEAIAQRAVSRDSVRERHHLEKGWESRAKQNPDDTDFAELLRSYKESRGFNAYLKERFVKFVLNYCPLSCWDGIVTNRLNEMDDYNSDPSDPYEFPRPSPRRNHKFPGDIYPSDINEAEAAELLGESYKHRSSYVHRGEQPPHREPAPYLNPYFQEVTIWEQDYSKSETHLLPNHELMTALAKHSIINWINSLAK